MPNVGWWYPPTEEINEELQVRLENINTFINGHFYKIMADDHKKQDEEMSKLGIEADSYNKRQPPEGLNVATVVNERWYTFDEGDQTDGNP